jgi:glyoxylase-like metal-dependent hydrolase (beta-lactamase superfamily II)
MTNTANDANREPTSTIQPTAKSDTFSSSTADSSSLNSLMDNVTYKMEQIEQPMPGLVHAVFSLQNYYFTNRIDRYLLHGCEGRSLFIDLGHPVLTNSQHLDLMLEKAGENWSNVDVAMTHFHPDHAGNMQYFLQRGGNTVYHGPLHTLNESACKDFAFAIGWPGATEDQELFNELKATLQHITNCGYPEGTNAVELHTGDELPTGGWNLVALETPGHALEHICVADMQRKVLFAGDHIIDAAPSIMQFGRNDHLLAKFFETFPVLKKAEFETVFMSHHEPLRGTNAINNFYNYMVAKFEKPLAKRKQIIDQLGTATVMDVAAAAQKSHGSFNQLEFGMKVRRFAMTFSLLENLADAGAIARVTDADDIIHYQAK